MVIVDRNRCEEIYAKSVKRVEMEIEKAALLKTGKTSVELNKLDAKFEKLGLIEE